MWDLTRQQLMKTVELPERVREVKQLLFLPHNCDGGTSKVCVCTVLRMCVYSICVYIF